MTAGQSAGQLRRANTSGMYVAITAVVAGALAIGILATLANHPATVAPAAAPIPVPPYEFRLDEHAASNPVSIPVPPYDFRIQEHDLATTAAAGSIVGTALLDRAADNAAGSTVGTTLLDRAADNAAGSTAGSALTSQEAKARAQMVAASGSQAASSHPHGKANTNGYSRWGANAQ
jgi:hypothetical protein